MSAARDRVVRKAARMFAESGFDSVSMRDLALELNMQAPSLYSHYASKEALLTGVCEPYQQAVHRLLDRPQTTLPHLLNGWRDVLTAHIDAVRIVHGDPAVRDLSCGRLGRLQDNLLALLLENHGIRSEILAPLIAAFRSPYMTPATGVDDRAVEAIGELILDCARQSVAS